MGTFAPPRDRVLWAGVAACAGALACAEPFAGGLAAAVAGLCLARSLGKVTVVLVAAIFALSFLRARHVLRAHDEARLAVVGGGTWPSRCELEGVVVSSPVLLGDTLRFDVETSSTSCAPSAAVPLGTRATLYFAADAASPIGRGDRVRAIASLAPPYAFANDGASDPRPSQARRGSLLSGGADDVVVLRSGAGIRAWIDHERDRSRRRILATFPLETSAMARALVLGEDDLSTGDRRAFRRSGLAHLLAVSGMHLVLVVAGIVAALRAVLVRVPAIAARVDASRLAALLGAPLAWIYAEVAGGSGSALRAAWMTAILLASRALDRRPNTLRAFGLSLLAMMIVDPLAAYDLSFGLSALATAGLIGLGPILDDAFIRFVPRLPQLLRRPIATTLAATIACAPVIAEIGGELPLSGLVANVVAVPVGEAAALPLCLAHALLAPWPAAEHGCAIAASGALTAVRFIARSFSFGILRVPPPTPWELGAFGAFATGAVCSPKPRKWLFAGAIAIVALEVTARSRGSPRGVLRATFLDVGQGDSAIVDLPSGAAIVIDGGGLVGSRDDVGERVVARVLATRRRRRVELVVLSHPHPDHYLGLASALANVEVGALWDTGQGEDEGTAGAYADLLASMRARGAVVRRPASLCGTHVIGGATVDVLAPCPSVAPDRGANDNSFVVRIRYGERAILFVGDAEHTEEAELVAKYGAGLRADVLKVGHHGSRTSSTPLFLSTVAPSLAVISCGVRNRFGHPHAATLAHLGESGIRVLRTDRDGAVTVTTDGHSLEVTSALER